jgi:hypothetical protein
VDKVDSLLLLLKIANAPFGSSMSLAGTAAELDHINPCVEAAKAVPQLRLELLDAAERCRAGRFGTKIDVVPDKSGLASGDIREEVEARIVEQAI